MKADPLGQLSALTCALLLVAFGALNAKADSTRQPIEEVRVTAFNGCGPWPISHRLIGICSYPQLKRDKLEAVQGMRAAKAAACLTCTAGICRPRLHPLSSDTDGKLCRKLFWTPTRVGVIRGPITVRGDLVVDFTYVISPRGSVTDIEITYLESDLSPRRVLNLIRDGAAQIDFEPVVVEGVAIEIVDLIHSYTLEAR